MTRIPATAVLLALVAALVLVRPVSADDAKGDKKDAPPAANPPPDNRPVIRLAVSPAAAPIPALRYELLPRLRDRVPGNAALDYHRAYLLRPSWPRDPEESRKQDEMVLKWEEGPIDQIPVVEVKKFLVGYASTFRALDAGARSDRCDWTQNRKPDVDSLMNILPEVQAQRELARFQRLRIRVDLAENDFDAAARGLQTGLKLGKDVGEGPTLIQMLVGIALTGLFTAEVEQWAQRPGAPNLYWALTTLPRPFIDPRPALEGEAAIFESVFPHVPELEKGPVTAERANQLLTEAFGALNLLAGGGDQPGDARAVLNRFGLLGYVALHYPDAKKQLVAMGRPPAAVEKMPPAQVVMLRAVLVHRSLTDDQAKCFSLPYPQARAELARVKERAAKLVQENETDVLIRLLTMTLPAVEKVYAAFARTERRLAALRALEAVRLHAAANNGQVPKSLADVNVVPVPDDPFTGKPFGYTADGNRFAIDAPPPAGEQAHASNSLRYEVTVRGK